MADIDQLITSFNRYVVRPVNAFGLGGFVFDVPDETTVSITTEITDHFTEDNSAIQDHVAVRPKRVVLGQYVGELVYRQDESTNTPIRQAVRKLTVLDSYLPKLTAGARQAKAIYEAGPGRLDQLTNLTVAGVVDLWATVKNLSPPLSRQQQAYMYFKALAEQKILVSLETPYEFMTSMAVEQVICRQAADSRDISEFTITLKEMRFARTRTAEFDAKKYRSAGGATGGNAVPVGQSQGVIGPNNTPLGRAAVQAAPVVAKGAVQGKVLTDADILDLSKDPIFSKVYPAPAGSALPPALPLSNLP